MRRICAIIALAAAAFITPAAAQTTHPTNPIRIVVSFPPGGGVELLARIVGGMVCETWGQPLVIDHRPGGSATLGPEIVARSAPDGHTLVLVTTTFTMTPGLQKVPYD